MDNSGDSVNNLSPELEEELFLEDNVEDIPISVEEEKTTNKKSSKKSKEKKADSKARTASAAVFFNENKSIAGFGNSMRAVFTSVRELVENSLDASEKRGVTPKITIQLRKLDKAELSNLMGTSITKTNKDTRLDFIEISCKDNGIGVPRELVPQLFGTVLAGTKYGAQQTRGRFGLGSKMVLLYAMSTLDLPIQITTRPSGENVTYRVKLFINLEKNEPIIHHDEMFEEGHEEYFDDYGTEIKVSFTGSWNLAKIYVREYFKQLAIITPYADLDVKLPHDDGGLEEFLYQRVVDDLPKPPEVVQIHPWGTDISTFRRELEHATEDNLIDFLANNFMGVSPEAAEAFFREVDVETNKRPQELTSQEIRRIVHDGFSQALKESKLVKRKRDRVFLFEDPKGDALSPLGSNRLRKGLEKELQPDFVETITRDPQAYEGHPFVIEAAIGYGGGVNKAASGKGVTVTDNRVIYRFANRIPLIFGAGSDLITSVVNSINWSEYGLTRGTDPLAIAVSLVSTKIPFPETSKEYIDKVEEIGMEVRLTLQQLGRKLKTFLGRSKRRKREKERKSVFEEQAPDTVENLLSLLKSAGIWDETTGVSKSRIIAALSSGIPRIDSRKFPPSKPVFREHIWSTIETQQKLQENGIHEISEFLRTPDDQLANILDTKPETVNRIKRRTINELELSGEVPEMHISLILSSEIERRFHAKDEKGKEILNYSRLSKSLPRRWIRNSYDYLVSPFDQLQKVGGLIPKLIEAEKVAIIDRILNVPSDYDIGEDLASFLVDEDEGSPVLAENPKDVALFADDALKGIDAFFDSSEPDIILDENDEEIIEESEVGSGPELPKPDKLEITLEQLLPPLELVFEVDELKKRKVTTLIEFLLETAHPSAPINEKVLSTLLIPAFKRNLNRLIEIDSGYAVIKVNVSSQKWIDGYLRNAFKRKKIATIKDIVETDDKILMEIGELQRTLYSGLIKSLVPEKGEINKDDFQTDRAEEKIQILRDFGINTIEQFASTSSLLLEKNEKFEGYVSILLEASKDRFIEALSLSNNLGPLTLLKEINPKLENFIIESGVSNAIDLFIEPLTYTNKDFEKRVRSAKVQLGMSFDGFTKKMQKAFKDAGIDVVEDLVFNPDIYHNLELVEATKSEIEQAIDTLFLPISLISTNLIPTSNLLIEAGVTSIGKFMVWPNQELAQITRMTEEWIYLIKESFEIKDYSSTAISGLVKIETISHLIGEKEIDILKLYKLDTVERVSQIKWGDIYPSQIDSWREIAKLNTLMLDSVSELTTAIKDKKLQKAFTSVLDDLKDKQSRKGGNTKKDTRPEITTVLQFMKSSEMTLRSLLKGKTKTNAFDEFYTAYQNLDDSYFDSTSQIYHCLVIYQAVQKIKSPIVSLSEFTKQDIDILSIEGIKTVNQLVCYPINDLAALLKISQKQIKEKIENSILQNKGTPLIVPGGSSSVISFEHDGSHYFNKDHLDDLYSNGYNTLESIFYIADPRTFELPKINWEIVNQFKKLLRSPPVFISWVEKREVEVNERVSERDESSLYTIDKEEKSADESPDADSNRGEADITQVQEEQQKPKTQVIDYYITFSSKELEALSKERINRVVDFATAEPEIISRLLNWDLELTKLKQQTIVLQEVGIGLGELEIFRPDHINHLASKGLSTIEDIYFTTNEETWDSTLIPYEPIATIKKIVNLSLANAVEELGEDMVEILVQNGVETILDLLLTGDPILEQKTGLPAERFENLKFSLDFGALINAFDKSILFAPGLLYSQAMTLMDAGYHRIVDLLLVESSKIGKLLNLSKTEVKEQLGLITRSAILKTEADRGVQLKDLNAFSRSDLRSVAKSGIFEMNEIDTLQEILYQVSPEIFQGEQYLLDITLNVQKICQIQLEKIGDINSDDVAILKKHNIITIGDALMVNFEDLPTDDSRVNEALNYVSNSIKDLSPFLAMSRIPAHTLLESSDKESSPILLEVYLDKSMALDDRALRNIRSLLQIPVRFTSHFKKYTGNHEDILELTIAEILLEYQPDEHPTTILQKNLHQVGSILRLMKEGSTPITLLDIDPYAYRELMANGYTSIEKILLVDEKQLANITGLTQKYWKNIKDIFDPDVFAARIGDIGLPLSNLSLSSEDRAEVVDLDIHFLDQITVFMQSEGLIKKLNDFVHSSIIFLIGTPGEKEMSENQGARNIIEAIIVMRNMGANQEVLTEMTSLAWQAYTTNSINLPSDIQKTSKSYGIFCVQDLVTYVSTTKDKIPKKWQDLYDLYMESAFFLPLSANELIDAVTVNRCSTIIDALTSPMFQGDIIEIRRSINEGEMLEIRSEIKLPNNIIKKLSGQTYKRIEELSITLQDILGSPRTIEEYKGVKQKYLNELRQLLRIPLSRLYLENNLFISERTKYKEYQRLEDLILNFAKIQKKNPRLGDAIRDLLLSPDTQVSNDVPINGEIKKSAETILNYTVEGFHELWTSTKQGLSPFIKTDTPPVQQIRAYIWKTSASIINLQTPDPVVITSLFASGIATLADLILAQDRYLNDIPSLTRKMAKEIQQEALSLLNKDLEFKTQDIRRLAGKMGFNTSKNADIGLHLLKTDNYHPLYRELIIEPEFKAFLNSPILLLDHSLSIQALKKLLSRKIYKIVDLLLLPDNVDFLPQEVKTVDDRLKRFNAQSNARTDFIVSDFNFPQKLVQEKSMPLSDFLSTMYYGGFVNAPELLVPLSYLPLDDNQLSNLSNQGIESAIDLFLLSPEKLGTLIGADEDQIREFLSNIEFEKTYQRLTNRPLQIKDFTALSQSGRDKLHTLNIHTLLDMDRFNFEGFSKNDETSIGNLLLALQSDLSLLLSTGIFNIHQISDFASKGIGTVKELITSRDEFEQVSEFLTDLTPTKLVELIRNQEQFSSLPLISIKDEKTFLKAGIFTFSSLSKQTTSRLLELGIKPDKTMDLLELLNTPWSYIQNISKELEALIKERKAETVADVLTINRPKTILLPTPFEVAKMVKLGDIFNNPPTFIQQFELSTLTDLLSSELIIEGFKGNHEEIASVIAFLHTHLSTITAITLKWSSKWIEAGIVRLWQYLLTDSSELATIAGTSIKVQDALKSEFKIDTIKRKFTIKTIDKTHDTLLSTYGFYSYSDLDPRAILEQFVSVKPELQEVINLYTNGLNTEIWKIKPFWKLKKELRAEIANLAVKLMDYLQKIDNIDSNLYFAAIGSELIEPEMIKNWIPKSRSTLSVQELLFNNYLNSSIDNNAESILRLPLEYIVDLSPNIVLQLHRNEIATVGDLIISANVELLNQNGIDESILEMLRTNISDIIQPVNVLPSLGLIPSTMNDAFKEAGFKTWSLIVSGLTSYEVKNYRGLSINSINAVFESASFPISQSLEIRNLNIDEILSLSKLGISTFLDFLVVGTHVTDVIGHDKYRSIIENTSKASVNKAKKELLTDLSLSTKISKTKVKDFINAGITSPLDIALGFSGTEEMVDGVNDWKNILSTSVSELDLPEKIKVNVVSKFKVLQELVIAPDDKLKQVGFTNNDITKFRESLFISNSKEKVSVKKITETPTKAPTKPTAVKAKTSKGKVETLESKKKTAKAPNKKPVAKKSTTKGKKKTTKKS